MSNALHACSHLCTYTYKYIYFLAQIHKCVVAILDSTIDQDAGVIHHEVLEVDVEGNTPNSKRFKCPSQHSIDLVVKNPDQLKVNILDVQNVT